MKTVRTKKILKPPINKRRQRILAKAFGTDRERVESFHEGDRGEDRRFRSFLPGFRYREGEHEASQYLSKTVARVTLSPDHRATIPRKMRARLGIQPGQKVSIRAVDGAVHIVPIRRLRKSERGSLPRLKPFVREEKTEDLTRLKQMLETSPKRLGKPLNPPPSKMKKIWKTPG